MTKSGIGFFGALFLVLLVLKLIGTITWSWWWITMPLWIGVAIFVALFVLSVLLIGVSLMFRSTDAPK